MLKQKTQTLVEMPPLFSWIKLLYAENIIEWHQLFDAHKKKLLEISPSLRSAPSHLIAAFGLPSLQPPIPSLCWVWMGGFSPCVVFIKLGQPSPYMSV